MQIDDALRADGAAVPGELRALAGCGGCAAKAGPDLVALLTGLLAGHQPEDPNVIAGLSPSDDAAVYRLDESRSLVASVDFFPPLVDDPADYGAIAAANALSDIFAMGGDAAFALTISGFPASVPTRTVEAITLAAADVVNGAGASILGGHSIRVSEPVFGLCVLGFATSERVWRKSGARPGDELWLSKPIGTGAILSAGDEAAQAAAIRSMRETNQVAARRLATAAPNAVTDVTGYGLLGHAREMADRSCAALVLEAAVVPVLHGALDAVQRGAGTSNDAAVADAAGATLPDSLDPALAQLLVDPQTSGGLLAAVDPSRSAVLADSGFVRIGHVDAGPASLTVI